jgi:hypothetical protein
MAVDMAAIVARAQRAVDEYAADDPIYGELMATYVVLGELLLNPPSDPANEAAFADECRSLIGVLIELGKALDFERDQVWAVQNTSADRWAA